MSDLSSRKEDRKCYECGHFGHIARDCLEKQNKGRGSKQHAAGLVREDHQGQSKADRG